MLHLSAPCETVLRGKALLNGNRGNDIVAKADTYNHHIVKSNVKAHFAQLKRRSILQKSYLHERNLKSAIEKST